MRRLAAQLAARWRALAGSASAATAAVVLLVCLCTLLAVVGPRAGAELRTAAYRASIDAAPALDKAIVGTTDYSALSGPRGLNAASVLATMTALRGQLQSLPLAPPRADWGMVTTPALGLADKAPGARAFFPPEVELSYRDTLAQNVRVIAGNMPAGRPGTGPTAVLQVAVTQPTARQFGLPVGTLVAVPGADIVLRVTAIVRPKDPAAPFWTVDGTLAKPQYVVKHGSGPGAQLREGYYLAGVFIAPGALPALLSRVNTGTTEVTLTYPLAVGPLTAAQATQLQPELAGAITTAGYVTALPQPISIALSSDMVDLLAGFESEVGGVSDVLDLLTVSLAVLAAVVVLLGGWLLAEGRRQDFAVLRARGASRRQLAVLVAAVGAVAVLPGAVAGAGIAVAVTPSASVPLSWWLAVLVVAAGLAAPVAVTVRTHRGYAAVARPDAPPARVPAARRLVIEAALVAAAAGGLVVLRDQGSGRGDVYASAAPVLLAVGVAVLVLRVYPVLARVVLLMAGRRAGAAAYLGLVRAARVAGSAVLPAFAMVLALALVSFAGMLRGAVLRGEVAASWQQVGADAVVTGAGPVTEALQRSVAAVPGVQLVVPVALGTGTIASITSFNVLVVDPAEYARLVAGSPLPPVPAQFTARRALGSAGEPVPVLASPSLAAQLGHGPTRVLIDGQPVTVRVVGQAASMSAIAAIGGGLGYVVVNQQVAGSARHRQLAADVPNALLVAGQSISRAALAVVVARRGPGGALVSRSAVLAGLERAPLQHGAYLALAFGAGAAGCCCLLVLLLSLLLSASARRLVLARMSTMGLSGAQGRVLGVVELLPQLVAVLAGGLGCALALVPLIGPALSLGVFTGSASAVLVRVEPEWLVVAGAGLIVLAVLALLGQAMLTDRTAAGSLRIGK